MKPGPTADYPMKVIHELSEEEPPTAELYAGVFTAVLNFVVYIVFIPDVSAVAPPWDDHLLPANFDEIITSEQARLAKAILGRYVVTPNDVRAGTEEAFEWGHDGEYGPSSGVVFYVTPGDFTRYAAGLARLAEMNENDVYPKKTVTALRGYEVIAFIERRVLASQWLRPQDAVMLGLAPGGPKHF